VAILDTEFPGPRRTDAADLDFVEVDPERYPNGRFAEVRDPEGNGIQLWQPMDPA
jgi:hypothetical protein